MAPYLDWRRRPMQNAAGAWTWELWAGRVRSYGGDRAGEGQGSAASRDEPSLWGARPEQTFLHHAGWMSGQQSSPLPVGGEVFFLTSPFIELLVRWPTCDAVFHGW